MNPKELVQLKLSGVRTPRCVFCPAIYEHKAKLVGSSVCEVAADAGLIEKAVLAEFETYRPDMLTIGIDIYNIEAEALGAEIVSSDALGAVPSIQKRILEDITDVNCLTLPDFTEAGRIPMLLEIAERINKRLGSHVPVRGALSGPYSIAAELLGIEPLILVSISNPESFSRLLDFTTAFAILYGKEYIQRGLCVCMFDSQASPPLVSPAMFHRFLLPRYQEIAREFKAAGCDFSELVIGGQTDSVADSVLQSGFDVVLCDYVCNADSYFNEKYGHWPLIRRNINPLSVESGDMEVLRIQIDEAKRLDSHYRSTIIGTGVLSYNVPVENILIVKRICMEA